MALLLLAQRVLFFTAFLAACVLGDDETTAFSGKLDVEDFVRYTDKIETSMWMKSVTQSIPFINSQIGNTSFLIEGDIVRPEWEEVEDGHFMQARGAIFRKTKLWPFNPRTGHYEVSYAISSDFRASQVELIKRAFKFIETGSSVRFIPCEGVEGEDCVEYVPLKGCWSAIGRVGGRQQTALGTGCYGLGTIVHETLHVLGLGHEHQRPDRDKYLNIMWENVAPNQKIQMKILEYLDGGLCTDYDYASVMHYGATAFSVNPQNKSRITLIPYDMERGVDPLTGVKVAPSSCDWFAVNLLYPINGYLFYCRQHDMPPGAVPQPHCSVPPSFKGWDCKKYCQYYPDTGRCYFPSTGHPLLPPHTSNGVKDYVFDPMRCGNGEYFPFVKEWYETKPSTKVPPTSEPTNSSTSAFPYHHHDDDESSDVGTASGVVWGIVWLLATLNVA